jgi:hypothetical protein
LHGRSVSKAPPPLLGFNNNVRHRGRIFHIQTEDSGVKFPRIVTHLFADGGRIVKTIRTDYSEHLEKPDRAAVVRGMMKEQHKAMFAALRAGDMDALLENVCGPLEATRSKAPDSIDLTSKNDLETARVVVGAALTEPAPASLELSKRPTAVTIAQLTEPAPPAEAQLTGEGAKGDPEEAPRSRRPLANPNLRKPTPSVSPPEAQAFDLDVASLDKNPPRASHAPASARSPRSSGLLTRKSRPPIPVRSASAQVAVAPASATAESQASALGRPQTRLAAAPTTNARSIFGDGAISEQSLDEVILSYLAEDLEETK